MIDIEVEILLRVFDKMSMVVLATWQIGIDDNALQGFAF